MNRRRTSAFRRSEQGFALMEVLIAFTVATIVMGSLAYGIGAAIRSDVWAESTRQQVRLARSRLEAAGVEQPLRPGTFEGEANGFRWRLTTSAARLAPSLASGDQKGASRSMLQLYWVEVAVTNGSGTEVRLATSKVAKVDP